MKTLFLLLLLSVSALGADTLHVYTWADYVSPEVVAKFEKARGCRVVIDTFDSNEAMFAKLKSGATGYDIIFPTSYIIELLEREGLLRDLDHSQLPNIKHVDPEILDKVHDKAMKLSVPYTLGYAVIAYRKDKVKEAEPTWKMFERADLKQRITLFDDMRETIGAALKSLGHSLNTRSETELAAAQAVLLNWKKNIAKFDNEGYKAGLDSGEFRLVHGYSGDLFQVARENENVGILIPREGVTASCDEMVIPKAAPQPALAHAFIDYLLDPAISAENMEWMGYLCPNLEALKKVSREFLENPAVTIPPEIKAKSEVIQDVGPDLIKYTKVWDAVKAE